MITEFFVKKKDCLRVQLFKNHGIRAVQNFLEQECFWPQMIKPPCISK